MAESEIPTLTVLLRKIGTLEGKHGESSPMLLSTIAKILVRAEEPSDQQYYIHEGFRIAKMHSELEWEAFFLRRAARLNEDMVDEAEGPVAAKAAMDAVDTASGIHVSAAQSYALVEGLITASKTQLVADNPVEAFHYASRAVTMASNSTRPGAIVQEVEARVVMGSTALVLSRLPEAQREAEQASRLVEAVDRMLGEENAHSAAAVAAAAFAQTAPTYLVRKGKGKAIGARPTFSSIATATAAGGAGAGGGGGGGDGSDGGSSRGGSSRGIDGGGEEARPDLRGWVRVAVPALLRRVMMALKEFDAAKAASAKAISAAEFAFGAGHRAVANSISEHIESVLVAGDLPTHHTDLAEYSIRNEWIKKKRREYVNKAANLAAYTEALVMADRALTTYRSTSGDISASAISTLGQKAELLSRVGRHVDAKNVQSDVVRFSMSLYGKGHPRVADEELALTLLERRNTINQDLVDRMAIAAGAAGRGKMPMKRWDALGIDLHRSCGFLECSAIENGKTIFKDCDVCQEVVYCSQQCQIDHWKAEHKQWCGSTIDPAGGKAYVHGDPIDKKVFMLIQELENELVTVRIQAKEYLIKNLERGSAILVRVIGAQVVLRLGQIEWMPLNNALPHLEQLGIPQDSPEVDFLLDLNDHVLELYQEQQKKQQVQKHVQQRKQPQPKHKQYHQHQYPQSSSHDHQHNQHHHGGGGGGGGGHAGGGGSSSQQHQEYNPALNTSNQGTRSQRLSVGLSTVKGLYDQARQPDTAVYKRGSVGGTKLNFGRIAVD